MTLASPRYELSASILLKKFLAKPLVKKLVENWRLLHKSRDYPPHLKHEFCLRAQVADFQKPATFNEFLLTQDQKSPLREGGGWLGLPSCSPTPHQGTLLFATFSLVN